MDTIFKKSISRKLVISGIVTSLSIVILLLLVSLWQGKQAEKLAEIETRRLAMDGQRYLIQGVIAMLTAQQEVLERKLINDLNVARTIFNSIGKINFSREKVEWIAANQYSKEQMTIQLPKMNLGTIWLGQNNRLTIESPVVDSVEKLVGSTCTIFQRMNDKGDMLRVVTNVQTANKTRATGTYIPVTNPDGTSNPVLDKILNGQRFVGRAYVVNKWYLTAYDPIFDTDGKVTGIIYVGVPEESAKSVRQEIMNIQVGKTGYVWVIDSTGTYIISRNGERDGENIWETRDAKGNLFVQEIVSKALKLKYGEYSTIKYPWRNNSDTLIRQKTATIGYFEKWQWIIGAGTYDDEIFQAVHKIHDANTRTTITTLCIALISAIVIILVWLFIAHRITKPIKNTVNIISKMSNGDLTKRVEVYSSDEMGMLGSSFNNLADKLQIMISRIAENAEIVAGSASNLSNTAVQIASKSNHMSDKASTVAIETEQASSNFQAISIAANQMSADVDSIATAIDELKTSFTEISQVCQKELQISSEAFQYAKNSRNVMNELGEAAKSVGKIIDVINDIADQTNLLALNATIEAASVGEVGKGFAVVAHEVKELARQTAVATDEIKKHIDTIQSKTTGAVKSIEDVANIIDNVNTLSQTIVASVDEQSSTISNIASNINGVRSGAQDVAANVSKSTDGLSEIAKSISSVHYTIEQTVSDIDLIKNDSVQLSALSSDQKVQLQQFKIV